MPRCGRKEENGVITGPHESEYLKMLVKCLNELVVYPLSAAVFHVLCNSPVPIPRSTASTPARAVA